MKKCFLLLILFSVLQLCACAISTTKQNPTAANYNVALGLSYLKQGDVEKAKQKLLLASQQAPHNPTTQDALGYFFEKTDNIAQANIYYLHALKLAPNAGETQNNYAAFLCRQGHYQSALQHFLIATQDLNYLHPALAFENAGRCALKIPDKHLAQYYFQKAAQADPKRATTLFELTKLSYNHHQ